MADAWANLIENSVAPDGSDAWEHLLAQEGGGGGSIVYTDRYVADSALTFTSKAVEVEFYYVRTDPDV